MTDREWPPSGFIASSGEWNALVAYRASVESTTRARLGASVSGVYIKMDKNGTIYIGKTTRGLNRLRDRNLINGKYFDWDRGCLLWNTKHPTFNAAELAYLEYALVRWCRQSGRPFKNLDIPIPGNQREMWSIAHDFMHSFFLAQSSLGAAIGLATPRDVSTSAFIVSEILLTMCNIDQDPDNHLEN